MDKIHDKTNKLFHEVCKKKNKLSKSFNKDSTKVNTDHIRDLSFKSCIYCQKVFIDSKFLMKHLLRRHSDELVLFYRNFNNREINYTSNDLQHLISILKKEFSSLKEDLFSAKHAVDKKYETDSFDENQTINGSKSIHASKRKNNNDDIISNEIKDLKEKMLDVEKDIKILNGKFIELDDVLKNEVLMKQDVNKQLVLSEEKIMKAQEAQFIESRQVLLNELKSLLYYQQQDISSEWKSQLIELRQEIKRLDYIIDNVKQEFICTDSLKEKIKNELVPHLIPHISKRKCKKNKLKHSLSNSKLSINKSCEASQQKEISELESFCFKTQSVGKLTSILADKLSHFSIVPGTSKLSPAEYNEKLKLINVEKNRLNKKYDNFYEIYNNINMTADQKVRTKLKSKKHHKITFSEPLSSSKISLNHSETSIKSIHEESPAIKNVNEQFTCFKNLLPSSSKCVSRKETHPSAEGASFTLPDKGASGDSVNPFSHKQNAFTRHRELSPVKEFETSSPVKDINNSKDLTSTFSEGITIVTAEQLKYNGHPNYMSSASRRKLNSSINNYSVQFKETPVFKTLNEVRELEDYCKHDDDFDEASSLETYKSSDDEDKDHAASYS